MLFVQYSKTNANERARIADGAHEGLARTMIGLGEPALGAATLRADPLADARRAMIDSQLRPSGVNDARLLARFAEVSREDFVPGERRAVAYVDRAVPLGEGRFLAPPISHGLMLIEARPTSADRALLVGDDGYLAALVRPLVGTLEVIAPTAALKKGPGGFSLILIDGAIEVLPTPLAARLDDDGRLLTGLVEDGVTRLAIGRKAGGSVGFLSLIEADFRLLPGFAAPRKWSF